MAYNDALGFRLGTLGLGTILSSLELSAVVVPGNGVFLV